MKYLVILAVLIGTLAAAPAPYVTAKFQSASVQMHLTVVSVKRHCIKDCVATWDDSICTGVIIDAKNTYRTQVEVLTAAHCVAHSSDAWFDDYPKVASITAKTYDGDTGKLVWAHASSADDVALAVFQFTRSHLSTAAKYSKTLYSAQPLYAFGSPPAGDWLVQAAQYEGAVDMSGYPVWQRDLGATCKLCGEGDSGGGIWTDSGYLVGIMNADAAGEVFYLPIARALADMGVQ